LKVLLDTSYLFPFMGVEIDCISNTHFHELLTDNSHEWFYADISLFEIVAKMTKVIEQTSNNSDIQTSERIYSGISLSSEYNSQYLSEKIDGLLHFDTPKRIIWYYNPYLIDIISEIRKNHSDFIDCLIFTTSLVYTDCLATMDVNFLKKIQNNTKIRQIVQSIKPTFSLWKNGLDTEPELFLE